MPAPMMPTCSDIVTKCLNNDNEKLMEYGDPFC